MNGKSSKLQRTEQERRGVADRTQHVGTGSRRVELEEEAGGQRHLGNAVNPTRAPGDRPLVDYQ